MRGLLGRKDFDGVLVLMPCNDVHTFGMRREIDIAFVDSGGTVVGSHRGVGARCRIRCPAAVVTIERFAEEAPWYEWGDHVDLKDCIRERGGADEDLSGLRCESVR